MRTAILIPIDSFAGSCTIVCPDRILIPPQRRFRMAIEAHLVELERKHKVLENELHEALVHLSTDDLQILELKRRKLMVKEEIERLRHTPSKTLHCQPAHQPVYCRLPKYHFPNTTAQILLSCSA